MSGIEYGIGCDSRCGMYADLPHKCPKEPDRTCNCCEDCLSICQEDAEDMGLIENETESDKL